MWRSLFLAVIPTVCWSFSLKQFEKQSLAASEQWKSVELQLEREKIELDKDEGEVGVNAYIYWNNGVMECWNDGF